jgi:hypothetical protein
MALGSTQPLREMSTRNLSGGKKRPAYRTDKLAAIYEPNVWKCGSLNLFATLRASTACTGITLPLLFTVRTSALPTFLSTYLVTYWFGYCWVLRRPYMFTWYHQNAQCLVCLSTYEGGREFSRIFQQDCWQKLWVVMTFGLAVLNRNGTSEYPMKSTDTAIAPPPHPKCRMHRSDLRVCIQWILRYERVHPK